MKMADIKFIKNRLEIIEQQVINSQDYFDWFVFRDVILQCIKEIKQVLERYERQTRISYKHRKNYILKREKIERSGLFEGPIRIAGFIYYKHRKNGKLYPVSQAYEFLKNNFG